MSSRTLIFCTAALAAGAFLAEGCHHAKPVAAPAVAPQKAMSAPPPALPETKVASPQHEFTPPAASSDDLGNDPTKATLLAEQKGWIRDAFFDFDSSAIRPAAEKNLDATSDWLRNHRRFNVVIEGHCDERGTEQYNLALGERRAYTAKEYLSARGIDPKTMTTISYGKEKPFDPGHDEAAWAQNRRAHVVLSAAK